MQKWKRVSNYAGEDYSEYFVVYTQTRDSGTLDRSNFECITEALDPNMNTDDENENIIIARASHWGCGWIDFLMVHESDEEAIAQAEDIEAQLNNYPALNDDHYYALCYEEDQEIWQTCLDISEKIKLCQEAKISIFAARSETMPNGVHINQ